MAKCPDSTYDDSLSRKFLVAQICAFCKARDFSLELSLVGREKFVSSLSAFGGCG